MNTKNYPTKTTAAYNQASTESGMNMDAEVFDERIDFTFSRHQVNGFAIQSNFRIFVALIFFVVWTVKLFIHKPQFSLWAFIVLVVLIISELLSYILSKITNSGTLILSQGNFTLDYGNRSESSSYSQVKILKLFPVKQSYARYLFDFYGYNAVSGLRIVTESFDTILYVTAQEIKQLEMLPLYKKAQKISRSQELSNIAHFKNLGLVRVYLALYSKCRLFLEDD